MNKYLKLILVAVIATAVVTGYNFVFAPILGLPNLQRTRFIASILETDLWQAWFINAAIGILFTFFYVKLFRLAVLKANNFFSGLLFGFFTFLIIQFFYTLFVHNLPHPTDYLQSGDFMGKLILNSLIANLIFGLIVGLALGNKREVDSDSVQQRGYF
jgi:hypothetical protein